MRMAAIGLMLSLPALAGEGFSVTTAVLEKVEVQVKIYAYGRVAQRPQYLYFEHAGNLTQLNADIGSEVKAGQILAQLDTRDIEHELRQAQEEVKHARIKYEQMQELSIREAAPRDQLENRRHDYELAQIQLEHVREQHTKHFLRTPMAGRVVDRLLDFAGPVDTSTPIFRLQSAVAPPQVSADLTQREVVQIKVGDRASITLPELPALRLEGSLRKVRPGSSTSGLFSVEIVLDPLPDNITLEAGMQVEVDINTSDRYIGYAVPITALLSIDGDRGHFFVVDNQHAKAITARLTHIDGDRVILSDDLSAYPRVVVRGQYQLSDGVLLLEVESEKPNSSEKTE